MQSYKSKYDAIRNRGESARVRALWLHLLALYFPRELGFGLMLQDWPCDGSTNLSIAYLARCNTDTRDLHSQHKDVFVLTSESLLHETSPETMNHILVKLAGKIRSLCAMGQDNKNIRAIVAAGTHVRFFHLLPGKEELEEVKCGKYWELAVNETAIKFVLNELKSDLIKAWEL